jgi:hypothetical protein
MSRSQSQETVAGSSRLVAVMELLQQKADDRARVNAEIGALEAEKVSAERAGSALPAKKVHRLAALKIQHSPVGLWDRTSTDGITRAFEGATARGAHKSKASRPRP